MGNSKIGSILRTIGRVDSVVIVAYLQRSVESMSRFENESTIEAIKKELIALTSKMVDCKDKYELRDLIGEL